jgi:hypothetical protein
MKQITILLGLAVLLLSTGAALADVPSTIERWVVAGGGGRAGAAPNLVLGATLGQPVVGLNQYADLKLCSGFRCCAAVASVPWPEPMYQVFLPVVVRQVP